MDVYTLFDMERIVFVVRICDIIKGIKEPITMIKSKQTIIYSLLLFAIRKLELLY